MFAFAGRNTRDVHVSGCVDMSIDAKIKEMSGTFAVAVILHWMTSRAPGRRISMDFYTRGTRGRGHMHVGRNANSNSGNLIRCVLIKCITDLLQCVVELLPINHESSFECCCRRHCKPLQVVTTQIYVYKSTEKIAVCC